MIEEGDEILALTDKQGTKELADLFASRSLEKPANGQNGKKH
jgi:hypothetical protein